MRSQRPFVRVFSMIDSFDPPTYPTRVQIFTAIEQAGIVPRLVDYTSVQAAEQPELQVSCAGQICCPRALPPDHIPQLFPVIIRVSPRAQKSTSITT